MEWLSGLAKSAQKQAYHYVLTKSLGWALLEPLTLDGISVDSGVGGVSDLRFNPKKFQSLLPGSPVKLLRVSVKRISISASFHITADGISVIAQLLHHSGKPSGQEVPDASRTQPRNMEQAVSAKDAQNSSLVQRAIDQAMGALQLTLLNVTMQLRGAAKDACRLTIVLPHVHLAAPSVKRRMHKYSTHIGPSNPLAKPVAGQVAAFLQTQWRLRAEGGAHVTVQGGQGTPPLPLATLGQSGQPLEFVFAQTLSQHGLGCRLDAGVDLPPLRCIAGSSQLQLLHSLLCRPTEPAQGTHTELAISDSASSFVSASSDVEEGASPRPGGASALSGTSSTTSSTSSAPSPQVPHSPSSSDSERGSFTVIDTHAALQLDLAQLGGALEASGALPAIAQSLADQDVESQWMASGSMMDSFATARGGDSMLGSAMHSGGDASQPSGGFLASLPAVQVQGSEGQDRVDVLGGSDQGGSGESPPWGTPLSGGGGAVNGGGMAHSWRAVQSQLQRSGFWAVEATTDNHGVQAATAATAPPPGLPAGQAAPRPPVVNRGGRATSRAADEATAAAHSFLSSLGSVQVRKGSGVGAGPTGQTPRSMGQSFSPDLAPAPPPATEGGSGDEGRHVRDSFQASASVAASVANLEPFYASSLAVAAPAGDMSAQQQSGAGDTTAAHPPEPHKQAEAFLPGFFFNVNIMAVAVRAEVQPPPHATGEGPPALELRAEFVSFRGVLPETAATGSTATLDVSVGSLRLLQGGQQLLHTAAVAGTPTGQAALRASVSPRLLGRSAFGEERWGTLVGLVVQHAVVVDACVHALASTASSVLSLMRCWPLPPATVQSVLEPSVKWSIEALQRVLVLVQYADVVPSVQASVHCDGLRVCGGTSRAVVVALGSDFLTLRVTAAGGGDAVNLHISGKHTDDTHQEGLVPTDSLFCLRAKAPNTALASGGVQLEYSWLLQPGSTTLAVQTRAVEQLMPSLGHAKSWFERMQPLSPAAVLRPHGLGALPPPQAGAKSCTTMRLALHAVHATANMPQCELLLHVSHAHVQAAAVQRVPSPPGSAVDLQASGSSGAADGTTGRFIDRPRAPQLSRAKSEAVHQSWRLSAARIGLAVGGQPVLLGGDGASGIVHTEPHAVQEPCLRLQLGVFAMLQPGIQPSAQGHHVAVQLNDWSLLQPGVWATHIDDITAGVQQLLTAATSASLLVSTPSDQDAVKPATDACTVVSLSLSALRAAMQHTKDLGGAVLDLQAASAEVVTPLDGVASGGLFAGQVKLLQAGLWRAEHCAAPLLPRAQAALQSSHEPSQLWAHVPVCTVAQLKHGALGVTWGVTEQATGPAAADTSVLVSAPAVLIAGMPDDLSEVLRHVAGPWGQTAELGIRGGAGLLRSSLRGGGIRSLWAASTASAAAKRQERYLSSLEELCENKSRDLSTAPAVSTVSDYFGAGAAHTGGGDSSKKGSGLRGAAMQAGYFGNPSAAPQSSGHSHHVPVLGPGGGPTALRLPLHLLASVHTAGQPTGVRTMSLAQPVVSRALRYGVLPASAVAWSGHAQRPQLHLEAPPLCAMGATAAHLPPPPDLTGALRSAEYPARQLLLGHVMRGEGAFTAGGQDVRVRTAHSIQVAVTGASVHVYLSASSKDAAAVSWDGPAAAGLHAAADTSDASTVGGAEHTTAPIGGVGNSSAPLFVSPVSPAALQCCRQGLLLSLPQLGVSFLGTQLLDAGAGTPVVQQMAVTAQAPQGLAVFALTAALGQLTAAALGLGGAASSPQHGVRLIAAALPTPRQQPVLTEQEAPTVTFVRVLPVGLEPGAARALDVGPAAGLTKAADAATAHALQSAAHARDILRICAPQAAFVLDSDSWAHISQLREGWAAAAARSSAKAPMPAGKGAEHASDRTAEEPSRPSLSLELTRGTRATLYIPMRLGGAGGIGGDDTAGAEQGGVAEATPLVGAGLREGDAGISTLLPEFKWNTHIGIDGTNLDGHASVRGRSDSAEGQVWSTHATPPPSTVHSSGMHIAAAAGSAAAEWSLRQFGKASAATDAIRRHAAAAVGAMGPHVAAVGSVGTVMWKALQGALSSSRE